MVQNDELEGIEYYGLPGISQACQDAVMRLLQFGDDIKKARIVTSSNMHCLLLTNSIGDKVAVKSGFSSGYLGEGPRRFSFTLQFLHSCGVEIDECEVDSATIERFDKSALTTSDLINIGAAKSIRPSRWYDYMLEDGQEFTPNEVRWQEFPPVIPFAVVDIRLIDLALSFWAAPDSKLLKGYRRLEDIVRKRTGIDEHGTKLFSKAFVGSDASLHWKNVDQGEITGRANLFTAAYMAHRNPRAHRELESDTCEQLTEFLLLNHLYRLEKESHCIY